MSGYSLLREIPAGTESDNVRLPNIVANQPTKIALECSAIVLFPKGRSPLLSESAIALI
jgi:hypothetical protein